MALSDDIRHPNYRGPNPFADEPAGETSESDITNQFGSPSVAGEYRPHGYEPILTPRVGPVFWFGTIGLLSVFVGGTLYATSLGSDTADFFGFGFLSTVVGTTFSVTAWVLGRGERRAIAAGAMRRERAVRLAWGTHVGLTGMLLGITTIAVAVLRYFI